MIGVYDSGFGGLTVLRALRAEMPRQDMIYLGDSGRAPYGGRDTDVILDLAEQCVARLFEEGCTLVVVACHTVSSVALRHLQRRHPDRKILGVTIPAAELAVARSAGHIGFLGTARTVASGTFGIEVGKLSGRHRVTQRAAALLAPLVEEGWEDTDIARLTVARYLETLAGVDTLVLGCTHYPLLMPTFAALTPLPVLDPAPFVATRLADWGTRHPGFLSEGRGELRILSTGDPERFAELGARFAQEPLPRVEHVSEQAGRLHHRARPVVPLGQVVR